MTRDPLHASASTLTMGNPLEQEISLFAVATAALRGWRRICGWSLAFGLLAFTLVFNRPKLYPAELSFLPQGSDPARTGLASLAGQFGLATPMFAPTQQPDFYLVLLQSREMLVPILTQTFVVPELSQRRATLLDLLEIPKTPSTQRVERGVTALRSMIASSIVKNAGIVRVNVRTEWPSVSLHISQQLLEGINSYNVRMSQGQAAAERKFIEGRLAIAQDSLRASEDRLQAFLTANRSGINTSPQLNSAWQRLERIVNSNTAIVTGFVQQYENVRIREVRDTPTITVVESPSVSATPEPRRRIVSILLGLMLGAGFGLILVLTSAVVQHRRSLRDPDADEFFGALNDSKTALLRRLPVRGPVQHQ